MQDNMDCYNCISNIFFCFMIAVEYIFLNLWEP